MSSSPVTHFDKYEVTGTLGQGGMGVVYKAVDRKGIRGREVAIKTLTNRTEENLRRFEREKQAGFLTHPNVVRVLDAGEQDGLPYLVLEFVSGEPLDSILKSGRAMPMLQRLKIIRSVCDGLYYCHQNGVIHRDIKPANVIVQQDGTSTIIDFGIARRIDQPDNGPEYDSTLTQVGSVIGTLHYLAPERFRNQCDGRADVFSTGVMLYLLLTGELPFSGTDAGQVQLKILNESYASLQSILPNAPEVLDQIAARSLAKNPDERYATAEEMSLDLAGVIETMQREQVGDLFRTAQRAYESGDLVGAKDIVLQITRIDRDHLQARQLRVKLDNELAAQERREKMRVLTSEIEDALRERRYDDALSKVEEALSWDAKNATLLQIREEITEKRRRANRVNDLIYRADEARARGDYDQALALASEAAGLDPANSSVILVQKEIGREAQQAALAGKRRTILENAQRAFDSRQFTEVLRILSEAQTLGIQSADIDQLRQDAEAAAEQQHRRRILEQIEEQIDVSIRAEQYSDALDKLNRALEKLAGEPSLLRRKAQVERHLEETETQKLVETTQRAVQEALSRSPEEALQIVSAALSRYPSDTRLLDMQRSVRQQVKRQASGAQRAESLRQANTALSQKRFGEAIEILEGLRAEFGHSPELDELLDIAQTQQKEYTRQRMVQDTILEADRLTGTGRFNEAAQVLEAALATTSDASLQQLLEKAREREKEGGRRILAASERVSELIDAGQYDDALRAIEAVTRQFGVIPELESLQDKVRAAIEREAALHTAKESASEALRAGELSKGIDVLEGVRHAYGEFPQWKSAISEYRMNAARVADRVVEQAVRQSREALLTKKHEEAAQGLQAAQPALKFASDSATQEWQRLVEAAAKAGVTVEQGSGTGNVVIRKGLSRWMLITAVVVVLLAGGALAYFLRPASPIHVLEIGVQINAQPWAHIDRMVRSAGNGSEEHVINQDTPMLVNLPAGSYEVFYTKPDGTKGMGRCEVSSAQNTCTVNTGYQMDIDSLVEGQK
ncbi:serine/threonine protein kinase [Paracidobacterium acidisoli]|uniref:serine/threonine protein kinase n=1 Tax=Paracidobacterium acidisoli TaxID=2303751 RepID=UPI0013144B12|nr:protein kinase [Paracidobacterium acidisoli]